MCPVVALIPRRDDVLDDGDDDDDVSHMDTRALFE